MRDYRRILDILDSSEQVPNRLSAALEELEASLSNQHYLKDVQVF